MPRLLLACLTMLIATSCAHSQSFFPRVELTASAGDQDNPGAPISGEDCTAMLFGAPLGTVNARTAVAHAVSTSGTIALTDVHVSEFDRGIWIAGEHCVHVDARLP